MEGGRALEDKVYALKKEVTDGLDSTLIVTNESLLEKIDDVLCKHGKTEPLPVHSRIMLRKQIFDCIRGMDVLQKYLEDEDITEIMVNGSEDIFIEKSGRMIHTGEHFENTDRLKEIIFRIVAAVNRTVNESSPIVDARLEDGSRVHAVFPPVAINGPILTIRRFPKEIFSLKKLVEVETLTKEAAGFLSCLVKAGYNIFISGGTSSGKTTFLNALSGEIPSYERVITIEDSAELKIQGIDNLVRMEARDANTEGKNAVTIRDLIRASLRMRPDRIIVGEVRGAEAIDMLQAMGTGHDGSISTGHANSPSDMLTRLEAMSLMDGEMPLPSIRTQIAAALDLIVHMQRLRDGSRRVMSILEVDGYQGGEIRTRELFRFKEECFENGRITGKLNCINKLEKTEKLKLAGMELPELEICSYAESSLC